MNGFSYSTLIVWAIYFVEKLYIVIDQLEERAAAFGGRFVPRCSFGLRRLNCRRCATPQLASPHNGC